MKFFSQISLIIVVLLSVYVLNFNSLGSVNCLFNQAKIIVLFSINKEKPILQYRGKDHLSFELTEININLKGSNFSKGS